MPDGLDAPPPRVRRGSPARGIIIGLCLVAPFWAAVLALIIALL